MINIQENTECDVIIPVIITKKEKESFIKRMLSILTFGNKSDTMSKVKKEVQFLRQLGNRPYWEK